MDIVYISTYPPTECGIATYTRDLAKHVAHARDCTVAVLAEKENFFNGDLRESDDGVQVYRTWNRRSAPDATLGLGTLLKAILRSAKRPDLIHIQHEFGLFPSTPDFHGFTMGLHAANIPVVVTLHTVVPAPYRTEFLTHASNVTYVVHTPEAYAILRGRNPSAKIEIIPHGVTLHKIPQKTSDTIICPGFIAKSKGLEEIIQAYAHTSLQYKLQIVGRCRDDGYLQKLEHRLVEYGIDASAKIVPNFVSEADRHELFLSAKAVILGAGDTTPYSASGQLHTALGYGKPIFAKNVPIYRGSGVMLYSDAKELSLLLRGFDTALEQRMISAICLPAAQRQWKDVADRHTHVYRQLVKGSC